MIRLGTRGSQIQQGLAAAEGTRETHGADAGMLHETSGHGVACVEEE